MMARESKRSLEARPEPRKRPSLFPALALAALAAAATRPLRADTILGTDPLVRVEGRSVVTPRNGLKFGFPGVSLHLSVKGPSLSLTADASSDEVDFDVLVDGKLNGRIRLPRGEAETVLFRGASDALHEVEIVHCTESSNGYCEVERFTAGSFAPPPPARPGRLLFIGDSFTCGAATECRPGLPVNPSKSRRQNARLSYGWMLSRRLNAEVSIIACAGRGLLRDWQGLKTARQAPEFYEYALADDPSTPWAHASYVPDAIGVCLGDDFMTGLPDETVYIKAYAEFVRTLRRDAPKAEIVLILLPAVTDPAGGVPRRTVMHRYLDQVVRTLGDPKVVVVDIGEFPGVPGDGHPDGTAHEAVAKILEPVFRAALR